MASTYNINKTTKNKKVDGLFWSLIGMFLVALIAIYAVLESKSTPYVSDIKSEADLYKIIEIDSD